MRALTLLAAAAAAPVAFGGALETGFETPEFGTGFVGGVAGWQTFVNNTTQPMVSDANPFMGDQHLRIGKETSLQDGDSVGAFSPFTPQAAGSDTGLSVWVNISGVGGASYDVIAQSVAEDAVTARLQFFFADFDGDGTSGDILVLDNGAFVDSGADYTPGAYQEVRIEASPATGGLDYFYAGNLIFSGSLNNGGTLVDQGVLLADNFQSGDFGDFDSFGIIPSPGAAALLAVAGFAAARRRR